MKAYVITTGTVFGLITAAHLLRILAEGTHVATDPWFMLLTVAAASLCGWAWRLARVSPGASSF
jgi:hypothetical protein